MSINVEEFGQLADGRLVTLYEIVNTSGASIKIMDLGATIVALTVPDREGELADVVMGFDNPESYLAGNPYFGAVVGRYANRIKNGKFSLNGRDYSLVKNQRSNHIHGGQLGYSKLLWNAESISEKLGEGVWFGLSSDDGDEGYPGRLDISVTYIFTDNNDLVVDYNAKAFGDTVVNLTQHSYFNLAGHDAGSVLDHELMICADYYTPVNELLIPTGEILSVADTVFDFNKSKVIGDDINLKTADEK